ncbi:MAG: type II secretion system F family protein [Gallintestinimicrobium sp.]
MTELLRPDSGEGDRTYVLDAEVGDEKLRRISVSVPEQELSEEEASALLDQAQVELERWVAAIPNPDSVEDDLDLPERFCGGLVTGSWQSDCYDLMDASGQIRKQWVEEGGELVVLSVRLRCVEKERECSFAVRIVPKGDSLADRLMRETGRQLGRAQSAASVGSAAGNTGRAACKMAAASEPYGLWILCLTIAGTGLISFAYDHDLEKEGEARQEELALAYPSFLARLTLLAQTGMPIRQIFARLSKEKNGVVYEEVRRTFREMESGMTQTEALERFGKRTRLPQYKKCAALLAQNIRRGTGELITALGQEAENAFEEQKAAARRKAEEAQTKLLFPMLLMLSVVMILILVPAWLSFGGL